MKYSYFPGCSLHSSAVEYNISTKVICEALGIELIEIPDWICCGSSPAHVFNEVLSIALPIRSLLSALEMGDDDVLTACPACFNRLKSANLKMRSDSDIKEKVNQVLQSKYQGELKIRHLLEVLKNDYGFEKLTDEIKKSLEGLKVACYYGCLLARPKNIVDFDDAEDPKLMDELLQLAGADVIDWPYKTECCGMSFSLSKTDVVLKLSGDILSMAKEFGAECIAVGCPLCHSNLDMRQSDIEKERDVKFQLPIFYFTQLIGLSFDISPEELALKKQMVSPYPLLRQKELLCSCQSV